eukprot:SAG31_NODE_32005_length_361_cov_0.786260_1_plen_69_part_10
MKYAWYGRTANNLNLVYVVKLKFRASKFRIYAAYETAVLRLLRSGCVPVYIGKLNLVLKYSKSEGSERY